VGKPRAVSGLEEIVDQVNPWPCFWSRVSSGMVKLNLKGKVEILQQVESRKDDPGKNKEGCQHFPHR
jgi:hypothetical protein